MFRVSIAHTAFNAGNPVAVMVTSDGTVKAYSATTGAPNNSFGNSGAVSLSAGAYTFLPLGLRVLRNIERIVREREVSGSKTRKAAAWREPLQGPP